MHEYLTGSTASLSGLLVSGDVVFNFIYTDTFVFGFFAALFLGVLWLINKRRNRGKFHRISSPRGIRRFSMRSEEVDSDDFDLIKDSLKEQFRQYDIEAIITIDKGGLIIGTMLAKELGMMCYPVTINTPAAKGNAIELETKGNAAFVGSREKTRFAILVDFDPDNQRIERVLMRMEASFPGKHICHKAFIAVTRKQLLKINAAKPLPGQRVKRPVIWTLRAPEGGLIFPW